MRWCESLFCGTRSGTRLEEASRLYFGDGDVETMLAVLKPLHAELDAGPTTLREASFAGLRET